MTTSGSDSRKNEREPPSQDQDHETRDREEKSDSAAIAHGGVVQLSVPEMDCPSCAGKVENALDRLPGVSTYEAQPTLAR